MNSPAANAQNNKYNSDIGSARTDLILWYLSVFFNSLYWFVFGRNLRKYSFNLGSCSKIRMQTYFMLSHLLEVCFMVYLAITFVSSPNEALSSRRALDYLKKKMHVIEKLIEIKIKLFQPYLKWSVNWVKQASTNIQYPGIHFFFNFQN